MASFDFTSEHILIVDGYKQRVNLNPQEALDLLHWLSDRKDTLLGLTSLSARQLHSGEKRRTMQGHEMMNMLRKGQMHGVEKGDLLGQVACIARLFGAVA